MKQARHRQFIILSGEPEWCRTQASKLLPDRQTTWISAQAPADVRALTGKQAKKLLGSELDALVFDAHSGFDAAAFGAVSGVLRGAGVLVMLTPALSSWPDQPAASDTSPQIHGVTSADHKHRFIRRLSRLLSSSPGLVLVPQGSGLPRLTLKYTQPEPLERISNQLANANAGEEAVPDTREQTHAIVEIIRVVSGHRRRPLVLTADRGRGKSAAFGMAAAELLRQGKRRILVTAPRMDAVNALFLHAAAALPSCRQSRGMIELEDRRIEFMAPDALILAPQTADLLLVDEAAGIPSPLLQTLLTHYSRIAFATTVHGYEGTGRGFAVRFNRVLDQLTPQWKSLQLHQPIRWAVDDPLEKFTFDALLLDAEPADDKLLQDANLQDVVIEHLPRDRLLVDEALLRELFGLLVIAHYRTTPVDLVHLLDGLNVSLWLARYQGRVAGAALVANEGGFDAQMGEAIWQGKRRPQGHLLPQTLASKVGLHEAAQLQTMRIIRIAVHPVLQGRGLGSQLLQVLIERSAEQGMDLIGSSFGATKELLNFWYRADFRPVRLGMRREASSGAHSALLLKPLSERGTLLYGSARKRFLRQFPLQLAEPLSDLDARVGLTLLASTEYQELSDEQLRELRIFADAGRDYADCLFALHGFALYQCMSKHLLTSDRKLLMIKILQRRSWQETARLTGLTGRKQVLKQLRHLVRKALEAELLIQSALLSE